MFKRGGNTGQATEQVQQHVDRIKAKWTNAPGVIVLGTFQDAPEAVRDYDAGSEAKGVPEGFILGGKVYLVADQLRTEADVRRVLLHEAAGHLGMRGLLGGKLDAVLDGTPLTEKQRIDNRRQAAEEVLAELAQTRPDLAIVQKAIAIIRKFLREIGFEMELSDNDTIAQVILPAREFIERGRGGANVDAPMFSRNVSST